MDENDNTLQRQQVKNVKRKTIIIIGVIYVVIAASVFLILNNSKSSKLVKTTYYNAAGFVTGWDNHDYNEIGNRKTTKHDAAGAIIGWSETQFENDKAIEIYTFNIDGSFNQYQLNEYNSSNLRCR